MKKSEIIIVDDKDEIIGYKERGTLDQKDIYRVSALWVTNFQGEVLLAKRHHTKDHHPGKWAPAVTGTVDKGETYEDNMIKEAKEELGIENTDFEIGPKTKISNEYSHFTQWYLLSIDKDINDFRLQENEIEKIKWFSPAELVIQVEEYPEKFIPNIRKYLDLFKNNL